MKTFIGVVFMAATLFIAPPEAHALFGHAAEERQRRITAEQQLSQEHQRLDAQEHISAEQQQRANRWQITAFTFGIAAMFALIAGTAIGSRGGRHAAREE